MDSEEGVMRRKRPLSVNTYRAKRRSEEERGSGGVGMGNGGELAGTAEEVVEEPLSPASRLFHEPHFNCHIIAMMGIGKRIDVGVIRDGLEATLVRHPRFSSLQVLDEADGRQRRWVRTKVVVEDHLVVPELDPAAAASNPDQLVEDYVASLSTTTLDSSRPLWDIHILNLRTAGAEALVVVRVHHSLGDGTSLMSLLLACTRKTSDPDSLPTMPEARRPPPAKRRASLRGLLLWTWSVLVLAWHALVDVLLFLTTLAFLRDTETPLKGAEGVEFHRKRFLHCTLSLDDVKAVKNAMGCTINDALIGVTSAGLSRYLGRIYGEGNDGEKKKCLPANIRLRSTLLVNIRPTPGIHALAEMMEGESSGARWGNYMGYIILPFSIFTSEDPLDYIRKGKGISQRKKNSLEAIFTYKCAYWIIKIFGIKVAAALSHRVLCHTTLSFSNVVGPVEEIGFYGHPLVYIAPSVYGHPQALTVHFQSYMNNLTMVLAVDELAIPDPHQLLEDLAESLKLIKDAVAARS